MHSDDHLPYGATAPAPTPEPLPVGWRLCPCGRRVQPWVKGQGIGHGIWFGVVSPAITLMIYALIAGVALSEPLDGQPVARAVLLALIPLCWLVALLVLVRVGHRGGCLAGRSVAWFIVWPGAAVTAIASAL
jgi:hypothetical protein